MLKVPQNSTPTTGSVAPSRQLTDLTFGIASTLEQVEEAWRLVYQSYRQIEIIDANPLELHTIPQAIAPSTSVVTGSFNGDVVSTLTMIHDDGNLPLDCVYKAELDQLRSKGRHLVEVGLLADRRASITRAFNAMIGMMRYVYYQTYYGKSILLCGVHPHHAGFYTKTLGFKPFGRETTYPTVKDHPVVLLAGDLSEWLKRDTLPKRLIEFANNPLPQDVFENRYRLTNDTINDSDIDAFLRWRQEQGATDNGQF